MKQQLPLIKSPMQVQVEQLDAILYKAKATRVCFTATEVWQLLQLDGDPDHGDLIMLGKCLKTAGYSQACSGAVLRIEDGVVGRYWILSKSSKEWTGAMVRNNVKHGVAEV